MKNSLRLLLTTLLIAIAALAAPVRFSAQEAAPSSGELPFNFAENMVRVEVRINGQGPFHMLVDTGANVTVLDTGVATRLGLKLGKKQTVDQYFGNEAPPVYQDAELKTLEIGSLVCGEVTAIATDLGRHRSRAGGALDGILGYAGVLHRRVLIVDYPRRVLSLSSRSPRHDPAAVSLPFSFRDGLMERLAGIHGAPKLEAQVNGKKVMAQLDTGYNGTFLLTARAAKELVLPIPEGPPGAALGAGGKVAYQAGQVDRISLGPLAVERPRVLFLLPDAVSKEGGKSYGMNVGNGFLRDYRVTIDYRAKRVVFRKPVPPTGNGQGAG